MNNSLPKYLITYCFKFDPDTGELWQIEGTEHQSVTRLSPVNRKVLTALIVAEGRTVYRSELFNQVWPNQEISDDALTRSVSDLRSQLKVLTSEPLIKTIPKVGYRWQPPVVSDQQFLNKTNDKKKTRKPIVLALILLAIVLGFILHQLQESAQSSNLIILNSDPSALYQLSDCLKEATTQHENLNYLSDHAVNSYNGNPYPFFSHEFAIRWFIDSELKQKNGIDSISLYLIDAKTGLVIYQETHSVNPADQLITYCQNFISFVATL